MAKLSKEEFFNTINKLVGDDTNDERLEIMDNLTDTYLELESEAKGDGTDWKSKYEENDRAWKEKYRRRFTTGKTMYSLDEPESKSESTVNEKITINDLFN